MESELVRGIPFFAEISQTEGSRGLGFALAAHAYDDEDEDGNEVGDHLVEALGAFHVRCAEELREEVVEPVEEEEPVKELDLNKYAELMKNPIVMDGRNCYTLEAVKNAVVQQLDSAECCGAVTALV